MNNRFGILLDEMNTKKGEKTNKEKTKDNTDKHRTRDKDRIRDRDKNRRTRDEYKGKKRENSNELNYHRTIYEKKEKKSFQNEKANILVYDETSFPEISSNSNSTYPTKNNVTVSESENQNEKNYLDAIIYKKNIDEQNVEEDKERRIGWTYYKRDKNTNKIIIEDYSTNKQITEEEKERENMQKIYKEICENYNRWKMKYIETWGYDQYEKLYLFSNYDYKYFDRLDYLNEDEMNDYFGYEDEGSDYDIEFDS